MNFVFKKSLGTKFICKNELFQSSWMKNELHAKFRNENNTFTYNLYNYLFSCRKLQK